MKISVVTIALNSADTIADTLRSVAVQDWPDFEHIVVDGASRDATMSIVRRYDNPRLSAVSEPDGGLYDAMNKGLARATGDVVGFLNSDDFFCRPDALSLVAAGLARGTDCVSGRTVIVDREKIVRVRRVYGTRLYAPWMIRFGHMPSHPSFYVRRNIINTLGGFDPSYRIAGDFELMVRLFLRERATMTVVPETLVAFREGGLSTKDFKSRIVLNRELARALKTHGIASSPAMLWARYPFKAFQKLGSTKDYPKYLLAMGLPTATPGSASSPAP
jgi:glycosyltransferase involved in cell wall biosynthesis